MDSGPGIILFEGLVINCRNFSCLLSSKTLYRLSLSICRRIEGHIKRLRTSPVLKTDEGMKHYHNYNSGSVSD